jgi:two-component system response regulator ChvI
MEIAAREKNQDRPFFNVMIIDDEKDIANIICRALERTGEFKIDTFYDGQSAFENFKKHDLGYYSLILTDIRMPKMTGFELAKKIREIDPGVKIVFMTAYDTLTLEPLDQMQSSIEVFVILKKPIKVTELAPKLKSIVLCQSDRKG